MQKKYFTRRLILRRIQKRDFRTWLRSQELCLPKVNKFDKDPLPPEWRTRELFERNVLRHAELARNDEAYIWNIFLKSTGELMGWIDLNTIARGNYQLANLGYFMINIYRRKGYGEEAVKRLIRGAFEDLGYHRLEAVTDVDNKASGKFALNCGLQKEGLRKFYWNEDGRWIDQMAYVITPEMLP